MIRIACTGRIGKDPIQRTTKGGTSMASSSIHVEASAYNSKPEDKAGIWISITGFGTLAEQLLQLQKGSVASFAGSAHMSRWVDKDGNQREQLSLTLDSIVAASEPRAHQRSDKPAGYGGRHQ